MNKYIFDTRFFIISRDYYPDVFPSFWNRLSELVAHKSVSSVDEVCSELENYGGEQDYLNKWMKENKHIFAQPTRKEKLQIREIFSIKKTLLSKKQIAKDTPCADPFVIAKAIYTKGIVVTGEKPAIKDNKGNIQGVLKIPNVCDRFEVPCITPQEFMRKQNWKF